MTSQISEFAWNEAGVAFTKKGKKEEKRKPVGEFFLAFIL